MQRLLLSAILAGTALAGTTANLIGPAATSGAVTFDLYHSSMWHSMPNPPENVADRWRCGCDMTPRKGLMLSTAFVIGQCYVASTITRSFTDYFELFVQFRDAFNKTSSGVNGVDYWKNAGFGVKFNSCWPGVFASRTLYQLNAAGTACDLTRPIQTDTVSMDRCNFAASVWVTREPKTSCVQERYSCYAAAP